MPCNDWGPDDPAPLRAQISDQLTLIRSLEERNNVLARLLCRACRLLVEKKVRMPASLREWWFQHEAKDRAQRELDRRAFLARRAEAKNTIDKLRRKYKL